MSDKVGFTSTVPVEVIIASGSKPVDLNNLFINSSESLEHVLKAERSGFPRNLCAWTKGLYSVALEHNIKKIICIGEGDCASSRAMCEVIVNKGVEIIPFSYPMDRDRKRLQYEIDRLSERLGTRRKEAEKIRNSLKTIREKLKKVDYLTWSKRIVTGVENHKWLVAASDFNGDYSKYEKDLDEFLIIVNERKPCNLIPLGYTGVPPILSDIYEYLNYLGGEIVFNETQRQFACLNDANDLVDQYLLYTYPYGINYRLEKDILPEIARRKVRGVIHYIQSFCHRQIEDIIIRQKIGKPLLTLEADKPGRLDNRNKIRLEAFMEML